MSNLSCPKCGTQLIEDKIDIPSKWGDFEMIFSNVTVKVCKEDDEQVLSMLTARLIQKFTIFFSQNPLPTNQFSLIGLENYLSNRKEQNKLIKNLNEGKLNFIKTTKASYRVNPVDLTLLASNLITLHNINQDIQDIRFAARSGDCNSISEKDLNIISEICNKKDVNKEK